MFSRRDLFVFMAVLLSLGLLAHSDSDSYTASIADIEEPYGCNNGLEGTTYMVANYDKPFDDNSCGVLYRVTCIGNGSGDSDDNPCRSDNSEVTVMLVGGCNDNCDSNIQLSEEAFQSIADESISSVITVSIVAVGE